MSTNVLAGLNSIPKLPARKLIADAVGASLDAEGAAQRAKGKLSPLIDDMQAKGWTHDMLRVSWIKEQPEQQKDAYIAFRNSLIKAAVTTMHKDARALIEADDDVAKNWPDGSDEAGRDYLLVTKNNRYYWNAQKGALITSIGKGLDKRKAQDSKDKRAAELKGKPDAEAIKAQDALMERVNAIIAAAAQSIKALDKAAKAAGEPVDSKSRTGKLLSKLRSVVKSGADFGIESE